LTLRDLVADGRIRPHRTSAREVTDLLRVADRDLADAEIPQLSSDRRFATAYNAALQMATIALYAAGFRAFGAGHHWATFQALPDIMGRKLRFAPTTWTIVVPSEMSAITTAWVRFLSRRWRRCWPKPQ